MFPGRKRRKRENNIKYLHEGECFHKKLQELTLENITGRKQILELDNSDSSLSVLKAAMLLQALASIPGLAYSQTAFLCLYWIIREIYTSASPDWGMGGAQAGPKGTVTAFTTDECVRAILSFSDAHKNTEEFFEHLRNFIAAEERVDGMDNALKEWKKIEKNV